MKKLFKIFCACLSTLLVFSCVFGSIGCNKPAEMSAKLLGNIVYENKSDYRIIISKDYTETEYFAATEMQSFIKQSTGVNVPLSLDTTVSYSKDSKIISIGNTAPLNSTFGNVDYSKLNGDGFIMKTDGNSLFINGANDRGTLYGTYEFLEKYVGVRFLTADTTYVPSLDCIELYSMNTVEIPAFPIRIYLTAPLYSDALFLARMRYGSELVNASSQYGGKVEWNTTTPHNTLTYVPTATYYKTAEDKKNNAHMYNIKSDGTAVDICFTDGIAEDGTIDQSLEVSAFKVALETLKQRVINSSKSCTNFVFSMMDTTIDCGCDRCKDRASRYMRSGNVVRFTNLLAREINKWSKEEYDGRTIKLMMFAYNNTTNAPIDNNGKVLDETCIPDENVIIRIAPINAEMYYSFTDPNYNQILSRQITAWGELTPNIAFWTYHTFYAYYSWYFPTMRTWQDNLSLYKDMGAYYVLMQSDGSNTSNWQDKMNNYVASKMLWNPNRDVNALQREFISLYFGTSADTVMEVIGRLDERLYEISLTGEVRIHIYEKKLMDSTYYPITFLEDLVNIIDEEIEKVENSNVLDKDDVIKRLKEVKITPLSMIVYNVDKYYADSQKAYEVVKEFVYLCEEVGFNQLSEGWLNTSSLSLLRSKYGI